MSDDKNAAQGELLFNRLVKRYRHLKKWARRTGTDTFRLYDRDSPEIPLVLDIYGDAVSGALYTRPYEKDEAEEEKWLSVMKDSTARALDIPADRVFLKQRRRMRDRQETGNQYSRMSAESVYRDVHEGDIVFRANLSAYLDTGLFLDARKKRALIRSEAAEKRVLNLFAYTCSLSVAAAKGGAKKVDSVDLSNTSLEWGKVNFALNGLDVSGKTADEEASFIRRDVFEFLSEAEKRKRRWDIIILDPPSFSNSKKMRGVLDIKRDYGELIRRCLSLIGPAGTLWFSSNAKGFVFEHGEFPGFTVKDMAQVFADEDFIGKKTPVEINFQKR
jgi:23S rRNA G2069 N7-methylase RlmK/C1962 C5-methylase RlmI